MARWAPWLAFALLAWPGWSRAQTESAGATRGALDVVDYFGAIDTETMLNCGGEVEMLGIFAVRMGHVDEGTFEDTSYGFGVGVDLPQKGGIRFDVASRPKAVDSQDGLDVYALSGWYAF